VPLSCDIQILPLLTVAAIWVKSEDTQIPPQLFDPADVIAFHVPPLFSDWYRLLLYTAAANFVKSPLDAISALDMDGEPSSTLHVSPLSVL